MNYNGSYVNEDYGGGGFMDSSSQYENNRDTPTKYKDSDRSTSRDSQSLTPVTLFQIQSQDIQSNDVFRLDNKELSSIRVVGYLQDVISHSTNVNFVLNDCTGVIQGRLFVTQEDLDHSDSVVSRLHNGMYVCAVGQLRSFQNKTSLSCFSVVPIEDFNQITYHFLEVIHVHNFNLQKPKAASQPWNMSTLAPTLANQSQDFSMDSNFSPDQKIVLNALGTCTSEEGLSMKQILSSVRNQLSETQLQNVLVYLTSEGHVYSTIDENHFKRTA